MEVHDDGSESTTCQKNGLDSFKMFEWTSIMQNALVRPCMSKKDVHAQWTTNKSELNVIDFTVIMRWKLLFMNGCECRSLMSARMIVNF